MTDNITVSRELLRQVLNAACSPYCAQDLGQLMPAIKAALEQPAPVQEPAAEILSDVIHRNAKKLVFTHHGLSLPVGTKLYTATQPAPVQEQQPAPASKPVLLQCLGCERVGTQEQLSASTDCDCWLHTQPAPPADVPMIEQKAVEPVGFVNRAAVNSAIIDRARGVGDTHTWSEKKTSFHSVPFYTSPQLREEPRNKGWAVAKSSGDGYGSGSGGGSGGD